MRDGDPRQPRPIARLMPLDVLPAPDELHHPERAHPMEPRQCRSPRERNEGVRGRALQQHARSDMRGITLGFKP